MHNFEYHRPKTIREAFRLMEKYGDKASWIAGGTDILVRIKKKAILPDALISLRNIEELKGIREENGLVIGSMTRIRDLERNPLVKTGYRALWEGVFVLANPQIRNVATIGGNLCNAAPCADTGPPLLVFEAEFVISGPGGTRTVPVDEFFRGPGESCLAHEEILVEIRVPEPEKNTVSSYKKIGRTKQDLAIASLAKMIVMEGNTVKKCRIAAGSVAPTPIRLRRCEGMMENQILSDDLLEAVSIKAPQEISPISDIRASAFYRRSLIGAMVK